MNCRINNTKYRCTNCRRVGGRVFAVCIDPVEIVGEALNVEVRKSVNLIRCCERLFDSRRRSQDNCESAGTSWPLVVWYIDRLIILDRPVPGVRSAVDITSAPTILGVGAVLSNCLNLIATVGKDVEVKGSLEVIIRGASGSVVVRGDGILADIVWLIVAGSREVLNTSTLVDMERTSGGQVCRRARDTAVSIEVIAEGVVGARDIICASNTGGTSTDHSIDTVLGLKYNIASIVADDAHVRST